MSEKSARPPLAAQTEPSAVPGAEVGPARKPATPKPGKAKAAPKAPGAPQGPRGPRVIELPPQAGPARPQPRHKGMLISFLLVVALPTLLAAIYMLFVAVDQYESRVGFAVRAEERESALDVLSGLTGMSQASSSDTDILYEFIQSQEIVESVDRQIDLRGIYTKPGFDPVFALGEDTTIEDLVAYWQRMVRIYYDSGTGLIEVRAFAFEPGDAHRIADLIFQESSNKINELSAVARADATLYAAEERDQAIERLIAARRALTAFRIETQIVDPSADIAGQMGLLNTLQAQLADALIESDLLAQTTRTGDPRIDQVQRRITVIEDRIAAERAKLGVGGQQPGAGSDPEAGYAAVIGEFEELQVDLEFAEASYLSALGAYDAALSEAQRTSRYLTAYVRPTSPESATAPNRVLTTGLIAGFALLSWFTGILIYYSLRDRR